MGTPYKKFSNKCIPTVPLRFVLEVSRSILSGISFSYVFDFPWKLIKSSNRNHNILPELEAVPSPDYSVRAERKVWGAMWSKVFC